MYFETFNQFKKTLRQIDKWLETSAAFAQSKSFDPNVLMNQRLAPDQFPFSRQVQVACDTAKLAAARLAGKDAPSHADTETTLEQLRTRVQSVVSYLESFTAADFAAATERVVSQPRWEGKTMRGLDYFIEHAVPNFYFHVSHAYAILRHNGVPLGKRDYLGALSLRAPS